MHVHTTIITYSFLTKVSLQRRGIIAFIFLCSIKEKTFDIVGFVYSLKGTLYLQINYFRNIQIKHVTRKIFRNLSIINQR